MQNDIRELHAYLAGLLGGEGTISVYKSKQGFRYHPAVLVANTNKEVIELFTKTFGGKARKAISKNNAKDMWFWEAKQTDIPTILKKLQPFLRIKRLQAQIVIEFCKRLRIRPSPRKPFPLEEIEARDILINNLRILNSKGKNKNTQLAIIPPPRISIEEKVVKLRQQGYSRDKIGELLGIRAQSVSYHLEKYPELLVNPKGEIIPTRDGRFRDTATGRFVSPIKL
jgi:DNA-binding CsgD family transcriptional regulator